MKIFACTFIVTLMTLLNSIESAVHYTIEERHGVKYGLKYKGVVFPEGTYEIREDVDTNHLRPHWIELPVYPDLDDFLSRNKKRIGKCYEGVFYRFNRFNEIAFPGGRPRREKPENGDKLERRGVYIAIYEGGAFRVYKPECRETAPHEGRG